MKLRYCILSISVLVCCSTINQTTAVEPYPGEQSIVIKAENLESLHGKRVRFVEHLETGPYQDIHVPTSEEAEQNARTSTAEDRANITTYRAVSQELMARLKKLSKKRYLVSHYKHGNGRDLDYLLFLPENYDETKAYPVVLSLHGTGESRVDDMLQVACSGVGPAAAALDHAKDFPCFVVVPRAKPEENWGYSESRSKVAGQPWRADWRKSNGDEVIGLLEDLETRYCIDRSRRYVMGQSMGGLGAFEMAINRPGVFAAAVPIVGVPYADDAPKLDCPAWLFTAEFERNVAEDVSKVGCNFEFYKAARAAGKEVRLTMFCAYGHGSHQLVYYHPGFWKWLFSQRRDDLP